MFSGPTNPYDDLVSEYSLPLSCSPLVAMSSPLRHMSLRTRHLGGYATFPLATLLGQPASRDPLTLRQGD